MTAQRMWRWEAGAAAIFALMLLSRSAAQTGDGRERPAARQVTDRYGLIAITGRVWGLPLEQQLRTRLKRLPDLRERIVTTQKELNERVARNEAAWKAATAAIAAIEQQLSQLPPTDPQRVRLLQERTKWNSSAVVPAELGGNDAVRGALVQLGQDRCTLTLDLAWIRSATRTLIERYHELAGDEDLKRLIERSGEKYRLGPARNYQGEIRKLEEYDKLALAPQAPIYLQSGRVRVTAAVNDSVCATFSWSEASDAVTYLPASIAQSAGIEVPPDARLEKLRIDGRTIEAREVFLNSLRLANCHATAVAAFVLPPEAEDLGAQLTPQALSPSRAKVERERLRMALSNGQ